MTIRPLHRPAAPLPVPFGTAAALAVLAHYETLDNPDNAELRRAWRLLIGPVPNADETFEHLRDDLEKLWSLTSGDWDESDLDELTDLDWVRLSFASPERELEHRLSVTVERLSSEVEEFLVRKRRELVDMSRAAGTEVAA